MPLDVADGWGNKWVSKQKFKDLGSKSMLIDPKRLNDYSNEWDGKQ